MRALPLHDLLTPYRASFAERHGAEVVTSFADLAVEYRRVRDSVGLTDFSFCQRYRIPEERGVDFLDRVVAGNVPKVRYGRILHTFIADEQGMLLADCYVANNDDELILLCESIVDDGRLNALLDGAGAEEAGLESLCDSHVLLGVDGFRAWAVVKSLFGADVLGLPYLSIETYHFEGHELRLLRAGKTSEFGYLLLAPVAAARSEEHTSELQSPLAL
jgi:aminomethyltransferase